MTDQREAVQKIVLILGDLTEAVIHPLDAAQIAGYAVTQALRCAENEKK